MGGSFSVPRGVVWPDDAMDSYQVQGGAQGSKARGEELQGWAVLPGHQIAQRQTVQGPLQGLPQGGARPPTAGRGKEGAEPRKNEHPQWGCREPHSAGARTAPVGAKAWPLEAECSPVVPWVQTCLLATQKREENRLWSSLPVLPLVGSCLVSLLLRPWALRRESKKPQSVACSAPAEDIACPRIPSTVMPDTEP
jgi:hypothetical protein